jgi:hypothetical protein
MGGDNVEQLWFWLCLIKTIITSFVVSLVVLLCKRFLRSIPFNRVKRRSAKHPMVHPLGTVQPTRKLGDLDLGNRKRRIGWADVNRCLRSRCIGPNCLEASPVRKIDHFWNMGLAVTDMTVNNGSSDIDLTIVKINVAPAQTKQLTRAQPGGCDREDQNPDQRNRQPLRAAEFHDPADYMESHAVSHSDAQVGLDCCQGIRIGVRDWRARS